MHSSTDFIFSLLQVSTESLTSSPEMTMLWHALPRWQRKNLPTRDQSVAATRDIRRKSSRRGSCSTQQETVADERCHRPRSASYHPLEEKFPGPRHICGGGRIGIPCNVSLSWRRRFVLGSAFPATNAPPS